MAQVLTSVTMSDKQLDNHIKQIRREINNYRSLGLDNLLDNAKKRLTFFEEQRMLPHNKRMTYREMMEYNK